MLCELATDQRRCLAVEQERADLGLASSCVKAVRERAERRAADDLLAGPDYLSHERETGGHLGVEVGGGFLDAFRCALDDAKGRAVRRERGLPEIIKLHRYAAEAVDRATGRGNERRIKQVIGVNDRLNAAGLQRDVFDDLRRDVLAAIDFASADDDRRGDAPQVMDVGEARGALRLAYAPPGHQTSE